MTTRTKTTKPDIRAFFEAALKGTRLAEPVDQPAPRNHNTPGIPPLTEIEERIVEAAREALAMFRKTFEFWTAIGAALKVLSDKAELLGGRKTFDALREREGLGRDVINKSRASRLLAIIERLDEVEAWRAGLPAANRFEWASPEAVHKHCPLFRKLPKEEDENAEPKVSSKAQLASALAENADMARVIERLERELAIAQDEVRELQLKNGGLEQALASMRATITEQENAIKHLEQRIQAHFKRGRKAPSEPTWEQVAEMAHPALRAAMLEDGAHGTTERGDQAQPEAPAAAPRAIGKRVRRGRRPLSGTDGAVAG